ncbi:tyrosine-type recombinase/integrase [Bacillus sp. FJAT-45350]|uniref:tyrosine-type recombinase/integrase n=1 Tax=Bacillus sp. FJAT-45350 TaxID=2011014 RepID=UPI000BB7E6CE|nr:tyrosine-type recombinase/integrase [Bacillus sp. FJAT-45350]
MEYVDPIKDIKKINEIKKVLNKQSKRDFLFFVLGINSGIRISDLLKIKVDDICDCGRVKEFLYIQDPSNGKVKAYYLNNKVKQALENYLSNTNIIKVDYLFKSKKSEKPITRQQAYRVINKAAKEVGITGNIGTHTLRKTFGYHAYKKGIAISILQSIFNHSSPAETLRYLGIDKDDNHLVKVDVNL